MHRSKMLCYCTLFSIHTSLHGFHAAGQKPCV